MLGEDRRGQKAEGQIGKDWRGSFFGSDRGMNMLSRLNLGVQKHFDTNVTANVIPKFVGRKARQKLSFPELLTVAKLGSTDF